MRIHPGIIAVAYLTIYQFAIADSGVKGLLGVMPGEESPVQGKSVGAPFDIYRVPTPDPSMKAIFPNLEVFVLKSNARVAGVGSKRCLRKPRAMWYS